MGTFAIKSPERCVIAAADTINAGGTVKEAMEAAEEAFEDGDDEGPRRTSESNAADSEIEEHRTNVAFRKYYEAIARVHGVVNPDHLDNDALTHVVAAMPRRHVSFDVFRQNTGL